MCHQLLLVIYRLAINDGGMRVLWLDKFLEYDGNDIISNDDKINKQDVYMKLFSDECRSKVEMLYLKLLDEMKIIPYEGCGDHIAALMFLQEIAATALWKYRQNIGEKMEVFVREFDRLDVLNERIRFYEWAKTGNRNNGGQSELARV